MAFWDYFDVINLDDGGWAWDRPRWKEEYDEPAAWGCALCVVFGVAFFVSACFTLGEARYWVFGRTAQASVVRANPPDETDNAFMIRYSFKDAKTGGYREEVDAVPSRWGPPPDRVDVEYVPGRTGASRVAGNHSWLALGFFSLTSLGLLGGLAWLYRDARRAFEPYHPHGHGHLQDGHLQDHGRLHDHGHDTERHRHAYDLAGYTSRGHDST